MKRIIHSLTAVLMVLATNTLAEQFKGFSITSEDVTIAKVVFSKNYPPNLEIILKHHKAQELAEFTKGALNQKVVIRINNEVVAEPLVKDIITGGTLEIQVKDGDTALKLAKSLTEDKKNSEPAGGAYVSPAAGDPSAHP